VEHRVGCNFDGFDVGNTDICYTDTGSSNTMTYHRWVDGQTRCNARVLDRIGDTHNVNSFVGREMTLLACGFGYERFCGAASNISVSVGYDFNNSWVSHRGRRNLDRFNVGNANFCHTDTRSNNSVCYYGRVDGQTRWHTRVLDRIGKTHKEYSVFAHYSMRRLYLLLSNAELPADCILFSAEEYSERSDE